MKTWFLGMALSASVFAGSHAQRSMTHHESFWFKNFEFLKSSQTDADAFQHVEVPITQIISEPENGLIHNLILLINADQSIAQVIRRSSINEQRIEPQELFTGEVVLARASSRDAVKMSCPQCTVTAGGAIVVRYLYNGITGSYNSLNLKLVKTAEGWFLHTEGGVKVNTLRLIERKVFGQTIGIEDIRINS